MWPTSLSYVSIMRTIIIMEETMNHRSQASWRARQGTVVVLTLGLTVVTPSLLTGRKTYV